LQPASRSSIRSRDLLQRYRHVRTSESARGDLGRTPSRRPSAGASGDPRRRGPYDRFNALRNRPAAVPSYFWQTPAPEAGPFQDDPLDDPEFDSPPDHYLSDRELDREMDEYGRR
ncbi:hypothetical protein MCOR25_011186, partial [Pyricularia grisea]